MVTHIVFWNFKDELSPQEKEGAFHKIKEVLEKLPSKIEGLYEAQVGQNFNPQGCDLSLYTRLESKEALEAYQSHPDHVAAASIVGSFVKDRYVVDYSS